MISRANRLIAIVAEDEALAREDLIKQLTVAWPELNIAATATNGIEALEALAEHQPQIAFIDIKMPGPSGLEVARAAAGKTHVVFTTAYDAYAVQAFESGVVDYLLKPIQRERLLLTIERLQQRLATKPAALAEDLTQLVSQLMSQSTALSSIQPLKFISASVGDVVKLFSIDEVLYFQSDEKYTRVVTTNDEAFIRKTLKELSAELEPDVFWQIHRSTIVRATAIARATRDDLGKISISLRNRSEKLLVSQAFAYRFKGM